MTIIDLTVHTLRRITLLNVCEEFVCRRVEAIRDAEEGLDGKDVTREAIQTDILGDPEPGRKLTRMAQVGRQVGAGAMALDALMDDEIESVKVPFTHYELAEALRKYAVALGENECNSDNPDRARFSVEQMIFARAWAVELIDEGDNVPDAPEPEDNCPIHFEDAAAIHRSIESYLLGWNLEDGVERLLGIGGKLNVETFATLGGRFALVGRVLAAVENHEYPLDDQAVAFLDELIEDASKDAETPLDGDDELLTKARREWLRMAKIVVYRFSGREIDV